MPSVSQRGMRCFDICRVMTCVISCQSVACQEKDPGCARMRRVERDDAAEAGAERADHARAARACGRRSRRAAGRSRRGSARSGVKWYLAESVFSASCASGIAYSRITGASAGSQLEDDVAFADLDELVELVEQREQVVGDLVERIDLERAVERRRALRFVAGAHQVHAELGVRARVRRIEGRSPAARG